MKKPAPIIYSVGPQQYARLCIASAKRDAPPQQFWNKASKSWGAYDKATLFAHSIEAANEVRHIQMMQYGDLPIRTFTVPIEIDLYGDLEMDKEVFLEWLRHSIRFTVDYGNCGNGPSDTTLALPLLLWDKFQEMGVENSQE